MIQNRLLADVAPRPMCTGCTSSQLVRQSVLGFLIGLLVICVKKEMTRNPFVKKVALFFCHKNILCQLHNSTDIITVSIRVVHTHVSPQCSAVHQTSTLMSHFFAVQCRNTRTHTEKLCALSTSSTAYSTSDICVNDRCAPRARPKLAKHAKPRGLTITSDVMTCRVNLKAFCVFSPSRKLDFSSLFHPPLHNIV